MTNTIDPIKLIKIALKNVKTADDYYHICNSNKSDKITEAWNQLSPEEQLRITQVCDNPVITPEQVAHKFSECQTLEQLQQVKAEYPDLASRAWKFMPTEYPQDYSRILALIDASKQVINEQLKQQDAEGMIEEEENLAYAVGALPEQDTQVEVIPESKRLPTLRNISERLKILDSVLDDLIDNPDASGNEVTEYLKIHDETLAQRDQKIENYLDYISSIEDDIEAAKRERERIDNLIKERTERVNLLKDKMIDFFQEQNLTKIETTRYKVSVCKNGGKLPVIFDETPVENYPENLRRIKWDRDTEAIRKALDSGEDLGNLAAYGERGYHLRIK